MVPTKKARPAKPMVPIDRTFVAIDVGQFLWAEVTPEAVRELNIQPGSAVTCHVKTSALQILS